MLQNPKNVNIELTDRRYRSMDHDPEDTDNVGSTITEIYSINDHKLASLYFICLGISSLLPWNTVLSTLDFFHKQFPEGQVAFYFPAAISSTNLLVKILIVWFRDTMSLNIRITWNLTLQIILMILLPIISSVLSGTNLGFWVAMLILVVLGLINQISYATAIGLVGYFPSKYMSNATTGTGLSGIMTNLLRMIVLFFLGSSSGKSYLFDLFIQYGVTVILLGYSIYLHHQFMSSEYAIAQINKHISNSAIGTGLDYNRKLGHFENMKNGFLRLWGVLLKVKILAICMLVIYIQTLMLYPGVMLKQDLGEMDFAWKVCFMQFVINSSDTLGKSFTINPSRRFFIYKLILCRFIFYFTFITAAITKDTPIIDDIWFSTLNIMLLGFTNGYTTTSIFIFGTHSVEGADKEIVGFVLLNCLSLGVMSGSFLAVLLADL